MSAGRAGGGRGAAGLAWLVAAGGLLSAALWLGSGGRSPLARRYALSPQECNTECQSRQTDCIDGCEGNVACERKCTATGLRCVARCRRRGTDAGVGGGGGQPGTAGAGGTAGQAGAGGGGTAGAGTAAP